MRNVYISRWYDLTMTWIKLNSAVEMWDKPSLGTIDGKKPIMALAVSKHPKMRNYVGIARKITKREGSPDVFGFVDRSILFLVSSKDGLKWKVDKELEIKNIDKIVEELGKKNETFIGAEDPDIVFHDGVYHVYFTLPFLIRPATYRIYLGHATGKSLDALEATYPIACPIFEKKLNGFKEACFAPREEKTNFVLAETGIETRKGIVYSAIGMLSFTSYDSNWNFERIVIDPQRASARWYRAHASPCRFIFENYRANGNLVGILNGREHGEIKNNRRIYGKFRPGLFLFNPRNGRVPWVATEPLFEDPAATTITFASDFVQTSANEGLLYAHVNDSFVRVYKIKLDALIERYFKRPPFQN